MHDETETYGFYGELLVEVESAVREVREFLNTQWGSFKVSDRTGQPPVIYVTVRPFGSAERRCGHVRDDRPIVECPDARRTKLRFPDGRTFFAWWPALEYLVEMQLAARGLHPMHGAAVESRVGGLVIAGRSGSGKTLVSLMIALESGKILADDGCFVRGPSQLFPYPRPANISTLHDRLLPDAGAVWPSGSPNDECWSTDPRELYAVLLAVAVRGEEICIRRMSQREWARLATEATAEEQRRGRMLLEELLHEGPETTVLVRLKPYLRRRPYSPTVLLNAVPGLQAFRVSVGNELTCPLDRSVFVASCQRYGLL